MSFSSIIFLFFFLPFAVIGYYLIRSELKNLFLLAASLLFYAWGEPKLVLLLLAAFGTSISIPDIALPLGISFFTFRAVSYCLDVYWGTSAAQTNPINTALYISFFPQVAMGPITRYSEFEAQLKGRKVSIDGLSDGVKRIVVGLAKKVILADQLGIMVDSIFNTPDAERTVLAAWLGILSYLFQLYFDFSGYSDMAIGIGAMFGFQTPENFQYPYLSKSVVEYWSRWHITLGTWLKVYLYTPVFRAVYGESVMSKKISAQYADYAALIVVWLFAGIWHGAAWHYVAYGLYYCSFIILERIWDDNQKRKRKRLKLKKQPQTKVQAALAHLYFLGVIIFGQLLFRVPGAGAFLPDVKTMFGLMGKGMTDALSVFLLRESLILLVISLIGATPMLKIISKWIKSKQPVGEILLSGIVAVALLFISCAFISTGSYNPFLYFNF